jgi:hypothetical protein
MSSDRLATEEIQEGRFSYSFVPQEKYQVRPFDLRLGLEVV